jgi:hypothetical protein
MRPGEVLELKPGKVIDRLVTFGPAIIAEDPAVVCLSRCVLATAIGGDILDAFGIAWAPVPVHVTIANAAYLAAIDRGADPAVAIARGGHVMTTRNAPEGPVNWAGHLILGVPAQGVIVDLDLRQFTRPERTIDLPAAGLFPWPAGARFREFTSPEGIVLRYECTNDRRFEAAPDWTRRARRARLVAAICRAIRSGHR